jgi:hypothetical protein
MGQGRRGEGRAPRLCIRRVHAQTFYFLFFDLTYDDPHDLHGPQMTYHSLPYEPRKLEATEARLDAIYSAARIGLKGDSLALAAGMLPVEYRRLCEFDPAAAFAEQKGRADGEMMASRTLHAAAEAGDAKAALDILRHVHGWVAKQALDINIDQTISITQALEMAQQRVIEGLAAPVDRLDAPADVIDADYEEVT